MVQNPMCGKNVFTRILLNISVQVHSRCPAGVCVFNGVCVMLEFSATFVCCGFAVGVATGFTMSVFPTGICVLPGCVFV